MTRWFVDDDPGYLAWLEAHPRGVVLNTWSRPIPAYLVLHRAGCRTIGRTLANRSLTHTYTKVCADTAEELFAWARAETGGLPRLCQICGSRFARSAPWATLRRLATASTLEKAEALRASFTGEPVRIKIQRLDGGPELVINGAQWLAELFFKLDPSAVGPGSYDARVAVTPKDRFEDDDITAVNRTLATHSAHAWWSDLLDLEAPTWLAELDPAWDLYELSDEAWAAMRVSARLAAALAAMDAKNRKLAVVTKVLHLKRPALVPVLDSLVIGQLGARGKNPLIIVEHVRRVGRANLEALLAVQHLATTTGEDGQPICRTLVRISDALLWTTHPGYALQPLLVDWSKDLALPRLA